MDVLERAKKLESEGHSVVHFEVGEPDLPTPEPICTAAIEAIESGETKYTHSMGDPELREAIAEDYNSSFALSLSPDNVVVTMGSSPALYLAMMAQFDPGDEILITDPHYSCYPQIIRIAGSVPRRFRIYEEEGFQIDVARIKKEMGSKTKALIINSPANPTGVVLEPGVLAELAALGLMIISDEIYNGIVYVGEDSTIFQYTKNAFVVNGFSKLYSMTGWRLGYLIAPDEFIRPIQKLQQNLFISPNAFVQKAGTAAIRKAKPMAAEMVKTFAHRREVMVRGLRELGFDIKSEPRGAFYVFVDAHHLGGDSLELAFDILDKAHVAVTPGIDFGPGGEGYLRFSYATSEELIEEGLRRFGRYLESVGRPRP